MEAIIATDDLTKSYSGQVVVDHLALRVPSGCIYGFLGPNGSGKSTTMKMLLGLVKPSRGLVEIFGKELTHRSRAEILPAVGSLIESPPGYGHLTGAENMRIVCRMLDLDQSAADRAVRAVRLENQLDKLVRDYSLGMKQRLGIAFALARSPRLLILDEPTNGLDPAGIEEMRRLLIELPDRGVTVMVSSHLLDEVDRMATVLGVLQQGSLIFQGTRQQLMERSVPDLVIRTPEPATTATVLSSFAPTIERGHLRLQGLSDTEVAHAVSRVVAEGISVYEVRREPQTLEDVFMDLTGRGGAL